MDCRLPGFSIHRIFQARVLEWVAISLSRVSSQPRDQSQVSYIADRHFTFWATKEDYIENNILLMKKNKHISNVLRVPKYVYSIKILHKV